MRRALVISCVLAALSACNSGSPTGAAVSPALRANMLASNGATPVIESFAASPASITPGGSSTLSWVVAGATSITITGSATAGIGTISGSSVTVTPTLSPTTYTLTATNGNGTSTATAVVTFTTAVPPTAYYHPDGWVDPTLTVQCPNEVQVGGTHACGGDMTDYMPGQCTACHGNGTDFTPDGGSSNMSCAACHTNAFASTTCGDFNVPSPCSCDLCHGSVQMTSMMGTSATGCSLCHGNAASGIAAPPRDTLGNMATTSPFVGAHQSHLNQSAISLAIACNECHSVPTDITHSALPISFSWGTLATSGGVTPVWNGSPAYTCTNYCHGATLTGGSNTTPLWTEVDGTQAACGTCHGTPPPPPHPAATSLTRCNGCHSGTVNPDGTINVAGGLHIDGIVEITGGTCTMCHGNSAQPATPANPLYAAPPVDTLGNSVTTAPGVGAHQAHLVNTDLSANPVLCTECHVVPGDFTHSTGPLNLTWGILATAEGAVPSFSPANATCSNVYCHGATLSAGGTNTTPVWTTVDGSQDACGTCHAIPPPASSNNHPQNTDCGGCHPGYSQTSVNLADHIDGAVEVVGCGAIPPGGTCGQTCTTCHGNSAQTATPANPLYAAPPVDPLGHSATTAIGVGAHQTHVKAGTLSVAVACNECHTVPTNLNGHPNGTINITWGSIASANGATPSWNATNATCTNYCHGATLATDGAGGTNHTPIWTTVNGSQDACGTCHGIPPNTGQHVFHVENHGFDCSNCHAGYSDKPDTVKATTHVNGTVEVNGSNIQSWTPTTGTCGTCSPRCHGSKSWCSGGGGGGGGGGGH